MTKTTVISRAEVPGFHAWPSAPEDVAHLRARHRHLFVIRVRVRVGHDDRCVEFHQLKAKVESIVEGKWERTRHGFEFGSSSCEAIARTIGDKLREDRVAVVSVSVFEDDENGAEVEWSSE